MHIPKIQHPCNSCARPTSKRCSGCRTTWYCSAEHLKEVACEPNIPVDHATHDLYRTGIVTVKNAPLLRPKWTTIFLTLQTTWLFLLPLPKNNSLLFLPSSSPQRKVSWMSVLWFISNNSQNALASSRSTSYPPLHPYRTCVPLLMSANTFPTSNREKSSWKGASMKRSYVFLSSSFFPGMRVRRVLPSIELLVVSPRASTRWHGAGLSWFSDTKAPEDRAIQMLAWLTLPTYLNTSSNNRTVESSG